MKLCVVVFLFPLVLYSQYYQYAIDSRDDQYFFFQTEVDARNAIFGGTVNEKGYNGVFKAGFSAQAFRTDIFYETFRELKYRSFGVNLNYILGYNRVFRQAAGIQLSFIDKPKKLTPSLGLNGILEYHFGKIFISTRVETKMRTDWRITVHSGFVGLGYKI